MNGSLRVADALAGVQARGQNHPVCLRPEGGPNLLGQIAARLGFTPAGGPAVKSSVGRGLGNIRAFIDDERLGLSPDRGLVDHNFGNVLHGRQVVHGIEQVLLKN